MEETIKSIRACIDSSHETIKSIRASIDSSHGTSCDIVYIESWIESCIAQCGDFPHCAEEKAFYVTALAHVRTAKESIRAAKAVLARK